MTPADRDNLRWYETRANHGAGRITAENIRLLKAGYLSIEWTGSRTWIITLSAKGRKALGTKPLE